MRIYWGDKVNGWKMYGVWIKKTVYIGVCVVDTKGE